MALQYILELFGTFFFAISGVLAVDKEDQDWFEAIFVGFVTALGGGTLRDVLLGSYPLVWILDINFVYAILVGIVFGYFAYNVLLKLRKTFMLFDTLGLALFTIAGTEKAISVGVKPEIAAIMGMFTAVMGGVIRDHLTHATPVIFRREIYATACLAGASIYLILEGMGIPRNFNILVSSGVIIGLRLVSVKYKFRIPLFKRETKRI